MQGSSCQASPWVLVVPSLAVQLLKSAATYKIIKTDKAKLYNKSKKFFSDIQNDIWNDIWQDTQNVICWCPKCNLKHWLEKSETFCINTHKQIVWQVLMAKKFLLKSETTFRCVFWISERLFRYVMTLCLKWYKFDIFVLHFYFKGPHWKIVRYLYWSLKWVTQIN